MYSWLYCTNAVENVCRFDWHEMLWERPRILPIAGSRAPISIALTAITTSTSSNVNPESFCRCMWLLRRIRVRVVNPVVGPLDHQHIALEIRVDVIGRAGDAEGDLVIRLEEQRLHAA